MTAFIHKIASRSAIVALALGTLSSVALAEPVELTQAQMEEVTAGALEGGQRRSLEILAAARPFGPIADCCIPASAFSTEGRSAGDSGQRRSLEILATWGRIGGVSGKFSSDGHFIMRAQSGSTVNAGSSATQ